MSVMFMCCLCYYKNEPLMVNLKLAKFHCCQQIQSLLITRKLTFIIYFSL
jgi:hypothetical protein